MTVAHCATRSKVSWCAQGCFLLVSGAFTGPFLDSVLVSFFWYLVQSPWFEVPLKTIEVGSGVPGEPGGYEGIISKKEGNWCLNGSSGRYRFDPVSGWLTSFLSGEKLGYFLCKKIQDQPLELESLHSNSFSKASKSLKILSSEIMTEIQKEENAGALFVLPSQLNGAEYPSHTDVVQAVEEYKRDNSGGWAQGWDCSKPHLGAQYWKWWLASGELWTCFEVNDAIFLHLTRTWQMFHFLQRNVAVSLSLWPCRWSKGSACCSSGCCSVPRLMRIFWITKKSLEGKGDPKPT